MNEIQKSVIETLVAMRNQDSLPLFYSNDQINKQFRWLQMKDGTVSLWDPISGFSSQEFEDAFMEWLKGQEN